LFGAGASRASWPFGIPPVARNVHKPAFRGSFPRIDDGTAGPGGVNVLGLNAYHGDVSAALVRDGQLIAAVEEERFRRIKHVAGFPTLAITECLRIGGISAAEVDIFAVSRDPRAHLWRKALYLMRRRPSGTVADRARNAVRLASLPQTIAGH